MTALVVDASVVLKWFVPESDSGEAVKLIRENAELIAPDIIWSELANAVWKNVRIGNVKAAIWDDIAANLPDLMTIHSAEGPLIKAALALAAEHRHPVYDCLYLALAIHFDARVVTVDKRFLGVFAKTAHSERVISLEAVARDG